MKISMRVVLHLLILLISVPLHASPLNLSFSAFLKQYQLKSLTLLNAKQQLAGAENTRVQNSDQWQSRLTATPQLGFLNRQFESGGGVDISNRSSQISGTLTQSMPTGTSLEVNGNKFIENQNPLFQSTDRSYSLKVSQDLIRNSFGRSQRALVKKADLDYKVAELSFYQSLMNSCEEAFKLYADTYIQQEVVSLLQAQLKDAKRARKINRSLFKDRLINKVDKLSSENDFIDTQLKTQTAEQQLLNNKRQISAFINPMSFKEINLSDPEQFLLKQPKQKGKQTIDEFIAQESLKSQELAVRRARSERWTDLQLGLEVGENYGRTRQGNSLFNFNEEYMLASLTVGFDLINNSENSELKQAIQIKNNLAVQKKTTEEVQKTLVTNLYEFDQLLQKQVKSSALQVELLKEKMDIAFNQMKRAKLNFENYLLHRNAYLNQKVNYLNLKKDLWINQFAIQKLFAHKTQQFCKASL